MATHVKENGKDVIRLGFDLGTNTSVVLGSDGKKELDIRPSLILSVVGYAKPGIIENILPDGKDVLFASQAVEYKLHLNLKWPLKKGVVADVNAAKDFLKHIRSIVDPSGAKQVWGVVGTPANATASDLSNLRQAMGYNFPKFLIIPEPFLAALGARDEDRLKESNYIDPTKNSLFIDIGAGTTDLCKIHGYYPEPKDQTSIARAGNDIDRHLAEGIKMKYPDSNLTDISTTRLKEQNSFVGVAPKRVVITVPVGGKPRQLDITDEIGKACESIVPDIVAQCEDLIRGTDTDAVEGMMSNIYLTGGGSLITGLDKMLEKELRTREYKAARVRCAENYKYLVARGALKTALAARDDQWQLPTN